VSADAKRNAPTQNQSRAARHPVVSEQVPRKPHAESPEKAVPAVLPAMVLQRERLQGSLAPIRATGETSPKGSVPRWSPAHKRSACQFRDGAKAASPSSKTCIAGDTNDGDVAGISHFTCASIFFCRESRVLRLGVMIRTRVVSRDGAGDFRKLRSINGRSQRLSPARGRLQHQQIFRGGGYPEGIRAAPA